MKIAIGFLAYNNHTAKYLPFLLSSIAEQTNKDFKIFCLDNSELEDNENSKFIKEKYPEIDFEWSGGINLGFGRGHNVLIRKCEAENIPYYIILNVDAILEPDFVDKILAAIENAPSDTAVIAPKIYKWDFENNLKTKILDSCGIKINNQLHFYDRFRGEDEEKITEKNIDKEIFGFTGAAALLRVEALRDVAYKDEFFDEIMFMYYEDCELSFRLRLAGWRTFFCSSAVCYHNRPSEKENRSVINIIKDRFQRSKDLRKWSFLNYLVFIVKYNRLDFSLKIKINYFLWIFKATGYALVFEQFLIAQYFVLFKNLKEIKLKSQALKIAVDLKYIESWFDKN